MRSERIGVYRDLKRKLLFSLAIGLMVVAALSLYADLPKISSSLARFEWHLLPAILGLTLLNYLLRFGKWHYYLRQIGVREIGLKDSGVVFFSGLAMVVTPGKVGEWLKSYLLREIAGTPLSVSAPIVIAERLTDGLALLLLASSGLLVYGYGWETLSIVFAGMLALVVAVQFRPLVHQFVAFGEQLPFVSSKAHHLHAFFESSQQLLSLSNLLLAVSIGVVSWAGESIAFFLVLVGLGFEPSVALLVQATFILSVSIVVGSISMVPGGLAVAEGSIAGLLLLVGATHELGVAAAATLLIRLCTLWFGVAVGTISLLAFVSRLALLAKSDLVRVDHEHAEPIGEVRG